MSMVRPLVQSLVSPLTRALTAPGVGSGGGPPVFSPASLFANGEQGAWYDPSDLSSMFQDSAGTTPVTATGQPVGRINDKSGNGNHAYQATAANRPLLQQDGSGKYYLAFDGVDDAIAFTGTVFTSSMYACLGAERDGSVVTLAQTIGANNGYVLVTQSGSGIGTYRDAGTPGCAVNGVAVPGGAAATRDALATAWPNSTTAVLETYAVDASAWVGLAFGFYSIFTGMRRIYQLVFAELPSSDLRDQTRAYVANESGVTL